MSRPSRTVRAATFVSLAIVAAFVFSPGAYAADNSGCLNCHDASLTMSVLDVDRETACKVCHVPGLVGSHPYHQPGSNCSAACHPNWGDSLPTAIPTFNDPSGASFASATSKNTSPAVLHIIHSQGRWPAGVAVAFSVCGSCHASAACNACHTGAVASAVIDGKAQHGVHSTLGKATANPPLTAYPAWTGTVGRGVVGVDQTINTISTETNQCASAGCHDLEGTKANRADIVEDYNYIAGDNPEDPDGTNSSITYVGTWRTRYNAIYMGGRASYNNAAGSELNATFTGTRVEVVSDTDPYRGKFDVYIDGAKANATPIDCYSATTVNGATVFSKDGLTNTSHTVSIRPLNQKSTASRATYVLIDGFNIYACFPTTISPACLECHPTQSSNHGGDFNHEASQTVGVYPGPTDYTCPSCHSLNMTTEHGRTSSKTDAVGCAACHTTYADYSLDEFINPARTGWGSCTWAGDGVTPGCHRVAGVDQPHNFADSNHDASATVVAADCRGCHGNDLAIIHDENAARAYDAQLSINSWTVSCLSCHGSTKYPTTKDCTSSLCHVASGVVDMNTHPVPPHPATNSGQGTVSYTGGKFCSTCHSLEIANPASGEHAKTSSVKAFGGAIGCTDCHDAAYYPTTWLDTPGTTNTCIECHPVAGGKAGAPHEAAEYTAKHDFTTGNAACGGANCHVLTDVTALHATTLPGNGDCTSCHSTNTAVPTKRLCTDVGCHAAHPAGVHSSTQTACTACHTTKTDISTGHASCATCHADARLTDYLQNNYTPTCTSCHTTLVLGTLYDPADPNHYNETTHTANISLDTTLTGGTTITTKACTACHAAALKAEHALTLSASIGNADLTVDCIECHTNTTLGSSTVVANNWPTDKCSDCHGTLHNSLGTSHNMSASATALGCAGASCHDGSNIAALHADRVLSTNATRTSCNVCHVSADTALSAIGCDSIGCHAGMTAHDHTLDTVGSAGCYSSGAGCHSSTSADYASADYHPDNGCTSGICHSSLNQPDLLFNNPNTCQDCHTNGAYQFAPDTVALTDPYPTGHYNETTHTAGATQMSATYTYNSKSAACSACHNATLGAEHARTTSTLSATGTTVCVKCHNDSATTSGIVTTSWPNKNTTSACSSCHADTDVNSAATAHGNVATHASGTNVTGCTGLGAGCHGTLATPDLTTVHPGCALTRACHSTTVYNPGIKTCTNTACHTAATYNTTTYAHGTVDGTDAAHQVTGASMATTLKVGTGSASATCATCHSSTLKPAHNYAAGFATASLSWTSECLGCHNATSPIDVASLVAANTWTNACTGNGCHNTTQAAHVSGGTTVPAVAGVNTTTPACNKSGCHATLELHDLHKNAPGGCGLSDPNGGCHSATNMDKRPTQKTCGDVGGCHEGIQNDSGHGVSSGGTKCDACHTALLGMVNDTTTYHHVLDDLDPFQAPVSGSYPTSTGSLSCTSCHVDHNMYSALPGGSGKAYSLRSSATVANPTASDTDAAMCLSCHTVGLARNTTGQKANIIPETKVWFLDATWWSLSPHNYDSPGNFDDGSTFRANCAKCHGSLLGTLSSGKFATHFSSEQRLLNALGDAVEPNVNEEQMCFRCHSKATDNLAGTKKTTDLLDWYGTQSMSISNVSIYATMTAEINIHGHKPHLYANKHLLSEDDETQAYLSANKHVECADCHNHHVVGNARHEWGTTNAVSEAIRGVTGQAFNFGALSTTNWSAESNVNAQMSWKTYSTYEYEICFKCHSGANTNLATWGGNKVGAVTTPKWTNIARDLSVGNQSRHPVLAPNDAYADTTTYGTSKVAAGQLIDIWAPGDTMYCSDCHGNQYAPLPSDPNNINFTQGPHGSSVAFSLRGPNTDWPINSRTGALFTINDVLAGDRPFCMNCHPSVGVNKVHANNTNHKVAACVNCHIMIPHGGGMSRLLGDGDGAMPARYAYDNNKATMWVSSFLKRTDPTTYVKSDCRVTTGSSCTGGSGHTAGSDTSKENW
ncbi:MAG: hypothetical protein ACYC6C_01935 [Coriobacteriia bacterium]